MQATAQRPQRAPDGAALHYERHRPEQTTLYRLVQQHAASFIAYTEASTGAELPRFIFDPNFGAYQFSKTGLNRALCILFWYDQEDTPKCKTCASPNATVMRYLVLGPPIRWTRIRRPARSSAGRRRPPGRAREHQRQAVVAGDQLAVLVGDLHIPSHHALRRLVFARRLIAGSTSRQLALAACSRPSICSRSSGST